jgi:hypothetical protein
VLHSFPLDLRRIPPDGIYLLFERSEESHGGPRIVRVGTHTGPGQLTSRLRQHFEQENKDRSIFRKHIGRCFLNRTRDPYLADWDHDRTSRAGRQRFGEETSPERRRAIEADVTRYLRERFSFVLLRVEDRQSRLSLESMLISTVSLCDECNPSSEWLGLSSPNEKICRSGLWPVNELAKQACTAADLRAVEMAII